MAVNSDGTASASLERIPTQRDVARAAGVHPTTVSYAMAGKSFVAKETIARVIAAAESIGYRPDPYLQAFNQNRHRRTMRRSTTVAYLTDTWIHRQRFPGYFGEMLFRGATEAAQERGLALEEFTLGAAGLTAKRLQSILYSRNIHALIVGCFGPGRQELDLDWKNLHAICIESPQLGLPLDSVTSDQTQGCALALSEMHRLGYRRIGLILPREYESAICERITTALLFAESNLPRSEHVPVFRYISGRAKEELERLREWLDEHAIDAVIANWGVPPRGVLGLKTASGQKLGYATLDLPSRSTMTAGIRQRHQAVGRIAVEQLVVAIRAQRTALRDYPAVTYVPCEWVPGPTAPGHAP